MHRPVAAPTPVVHTHELSVDLGTGPILNGVSLDVADGEAVALLGANGSGKTTLVKALLGLVPVSGGQARLYGVDITERQSLPWSRIGYVPQCLNYSAGVPATAAEVVASGLLSNRRFRPGQGSRGRIMDALDEVGLAGRAGESIQIFSGGQQQRVLIARALVRRPELLIIDEPLAGIDQASREELASTLAMLQRSGTTILVVLHGLAELGTIIDRTIVLHHGKVIQDAPWSSGAVGGDSPAHDHAHEPVPAAHTIPYLQIGR